MSVYSNDSLNGDDTFAIDAEEEIDYYALLNVPRDAKIEEIHKAYKLRCLIFHPDRHNNEKDKNEASKVFVLLRQAYETLTDTDLRLIYDTVGIRGMDMHGWQLLQRSTNPENIRKEYEFLKRLRENEIMLQRVHPTTSFSVKTNFAGLFPEYREDRYFPQVAELVLSQSVDCTMTEKDKIGLVGRVRSSNGKGDGAFITSWKRSISSTLHLENAITFTPDSVENSLKLSKTVSSRAVCMLQPTLQYLPFSGQFTPSIMFLYTMQLRANWQGIIAYNLSFANSSFTTSIIKRELNQPKFLANFTISPINPNMRLMYNKRYSENELRCETSCALSLYNVTPSILLERRLSKFTKIGIFFKFSYPSCFLHAKLKLKTSSHNYEFQAILCDNQEDLARSIIYGLLLPLAVVNVAKIVFHKPFSRFMRIFDDHSEDDQVNESKKEECQRMIHLMRSTAERITLEEERKMGLVIVEAQYGQMVNNSPGYPLAGERTIDVTIPLQALVNDSQLRIYSAKDQMPGFYDPCPGEMKMLRVVYRFHGEMHAITVVDEQALNIPLQSHRINSG